MKFDMYVKNIRTSNLTVRFLKFTKYIYIYIIYKKFEKILFKLVWSKILFSMRLLKAYGLMMWVLNSGNQAERRERILQWDKCSN